MRTSAAGSRTSRGFTLIELLVVLAIMAIATAGVTFALRDTQAVQLEREAQRLAALFESARALSRSTGIPVRWQSTDTGFRFDGLPPGTLPDRWLSESTRTEGPALVVLGPEPVIGRQQIAITSAAAPQRTVRVATDGLRPFAIVGTNDGS